MGTERMGRRAGVQASTAGPGPARPREELCCRVGFGVSISVSEAGPVLVTELKFVSRRVPGPWPSHPRKKERLG